ncbi:MAG: HAD-IC family P-type ATPase, partial [Clostridia bacterium]|nr:HAD-IC family P-type ATPase [Clostridia bacterium]
VDGREIAVGNASLMALAGASLPLSSIGSAPDNYSAATCVYIAADGKYEGRILISDQLKPTARDAVNSLRENGIDRVVMLTGDRAETAAAVGADLGISEYYSELLPADKVEKLELLLAETESKYKLAFTGDGINDAPVLVRADVGIAMGGIGSDAAIEAADVVLMDDDPMKIVKAIRISRKCMRIIYENIVFSIGVKLLALALVAFGIGGMWLAVFADVGVMVLAVLNAIRALKTT